MPDPSRSRPLRLGTRVQLAGIPRLCERPAATSTRSLVRGIQGPRQPELGNSATFGRVTGAATKVTLEGGSTLARSRVQRPTMRFAIAALVAASLSAALLGHPGHSRGAIEAVGTQSSVKVAVVPGFRAPIYPGFSGVGQFPAGNPRLSAYHFSAAGREQSQRKQPRLVRHGDPVRDQLERHLRQRAGGAEHVRRHAQGA